MTTDDRAVTLLRQELATATAGLVPRPDVAARAAAGGRRRLRRRRITEVAVTAGAALAVAVAVMAPLSLHGSASQPAKRPDPAPSVRSDTPAAGDPMLWLYQRPAQGDLARDTAYVRSVVQLWNAGHAKSGKPASDQFLSFRGEPRVVWAGGTPAGPAALVVQPATFLGNTATGAGPGTGTAIGFVGVDDGGGPRLVEESSSEEGRTPSDGPMTAWFVDPGRTVVAALELGKPLAWAQGWKYRDDGTREREWKPMTFRDGVSTARVDGTRTWDVEVAPTPYDAAAGNIVIAGGEPPPGAGQSLRWGPDPLTGAPAVMQIKGLTPTPGDEQPYGVFARALDARLHGRPHRSSNDLPAWTASGILPDGTRVVVSDAYLDADPSHAYAVLDRNGSARVVHGGVVDRFAVLPIVIRLPDGGGTVVARSQARLEWSSPTTPWQEMGFGAAVVPPDATRVRVTLPGQEVHIVDLPRLGDAP